MRTSAAWAALSYSESFLLMTTSFWCFFVQREGWGPVACALGTTPMLWKSERILGRNWGTNTPKTLYNIQLSAIWSILSILNWALVWIGGGGVILGEIWPTPIAAPYSRRLYNTHTHTGIEQGVGTDETIYLPTVNKKRQKWTKRVWLD